MGKNIMSSLYFEIIEKFKIDKNEIQIFDHSYKNNENLKKLEKGYEYYLSKTKKKDQILFMEFSLKIDKTLNDIKRKNRNYYSHRKSYYKIKNYIFIFIDPITNNRL